MKAYKGFEPGLVCLGYQFSASGVNQTDKANCRKNGFHCAENPLDCLDYYRDWRRSVYYEVEALGDLDEDGMDSKISCTRMRLVRKLSLYDLLLEAVVYMVKHPRRKWNSRVRTESSAYGDGFCIARGKQPRAMGKMEDILVLVREKADSAEVAEVALLQIDGKKYHPDAWYDVRGLCMEGKNGEEKTAGMQAA